MAKTAPKEVWRAVRRYALVGDMRKARLQLKAMVQKYPQDDEAAAELRRLDNNQPLHCTENSQERRARRAEEALTALEETLPHYSSAHTLAATPTDKLTRLHRDLLAQLRALAENKTPAPLGTNAYKKALTRELSRRRKKSARTSMTLAGVLLGVLLLAGGMVWLLRSRAEDQLLQLDKARTTQDWERAALLLRVADSGINRLVYPRTNEITARVRSWQQASIAAADELSVRLHIYEKREAISTLSLEERADFLRRIRALPAHFSQGLLARWDELCRPEREKLDAQRDAIVADTEAASAAPTLSGRVAEDTTLLRNTRTRLQRAIDVFGNAREAFDLPPELISPCRMLLSQVEAYLADAELLTRAEAQLRSAYTYEQHLNALATIAPKHYPPAIAAAQAGSALPTEESICNTVRAKRFNLPLDIPPAVVNAIVNKGPTFCTGYPATLPQLHLMEDLFTARSMHQRVYEVFRASGEVHYTEQPPTVLHEKNSVRFTLSELDPARRIDRSPHVEWENAHAVWVRTLDASPIIKATGISRERFFLTANLPMLLGRLTDIHDANCPALAKAYTYHTLLELMRMHSADIIGLRFSPLLQEDIKSFRLLISRCKVQLGVTCWLSRSKQTLEAESLCAQWFAEHTKRDYATEMSRNFSRILRTRPIYAGYVDTEGKPHLRRPPVEAVKLWYLSGGQLICTPCGAPLKAPAPYSPVFFETP